LDGVCYGRGAVARRPGPRRPETTTPLRMTRLIVAAEPRRELADDEWMFIAVEAGFHDMLTICGAVFRSATRWCDPRAWWHGLSGQDPLDMD